jgi:regulator of ribonuclease activity A
MGLKRVSFKTADLYDRYADSVLVSDPCFRNYGGKRRFAGPAVTVKCFEDNSRVKETLAEPGEGSVLVVDAGGSMRCAMLGDLIARSAVENGWSGVLMYGCVRDSIELAGMDLGVKALGATPRKSVRRGEGQRDLRIRFAGVTVNPGDHVYCDEDGVLVSREVLD